MSGFKKIAVVYDWIDKWGGVERVLLHLREMFPQAAFYSSYYNPERAGWAEGIKIRTSFIQQLPKIISRNRILSLPFYPYAFEMFDFSGYDLVISVTSSFAKSVITGPGTFHLCYLLTPTRFLWIRQNDYLKNNLLKNMLSPYLTKLRKWDYLAAQRPDKIISISRTVAGRCKKYYRRDSEVICPPFDVKYWKKIKSGLKIQKSKIIDVSRKYFLAVSRLESYKKVDLLVQLFNRLAGKAGQPDYNLVVVGEGSQENKLKRLAGNRITFLKNIPDADLGYLYSNAEALIMPQEEDFGYVSLEAQSFGCPVISFHMGGAAETVIDGKTGIFFKEQSSGSIKTALERFFMVKYRLKSSIGVQGDENVNRFAKETFEGKFLSKLKSIVKR